MILNYRNGGARNGCAERAAKMAAAKRETLNQWLAEEMQDEEFRLLWNKREAAYRVARMIIHLRKAKGLSQTEVARRAGLKQPAIARLEAGAVKPSLDTIQRVVQALGKDVEIKIIPQSSRTTRPKIKQSAGAAGHSFAALG